MTFSIKGLALTTGLLWAASVLLLGVINMIWPSYGTAAIGVLQSLYPGYANTTGFVGVIVGTLYAAVDGAIAGAVFAWLYNRMAKV